MFKVIYKHFKIGNTIVLFTSSPLKFEPVELFTFLFIFRDFITNKITQLIVRARDKKLDIIEITEVKPKNSRYKPHLAEYSLTEVGNYKMF
jgi:hypothetical protein